jgi:hypothetical protein
VTTASGLPRIPTGKPRFTFRIDGAPATLGISPAPVTELVRTEQVGSVTAGRAALIIRQHLDAFAGGDGA